MGAPPPGLYDSFTEQGLFWLPEREEDKQSGSLSYDPENGAVLEVFGIFGDLAEAFNRALGGSDADKPSVIHGVTMRGKPVSLLKAFNSTSKLHMPGIPHETWKSNLLVIGLHITSVDNEAIFPKSYCRFEAIEAWLEHRPFSDRLDNETKTFSVLAQKPREVAFASHAEFEVSTVGSLYSNNDPATRFLIDVTSQMAITPGEPQSLNWHLDRAARLQELASLCSGRYLPLTSFELRSHEIEHEDGTKRPAEVHFYARLIHGEGQEGIGSKRLTPIITGPELNRFNPRAVQLWFDQYEDFSPALRLFFTITGERNMFVNIRLLLAIQALEVFHRRTSGESVMEEGAFSVFTDAMIAAIPTDTELNMREKLESLYRYANEPSLKQRLRSIVTALTEAFGEAPGGFNRKFIRKLVDTRNYYTHFSKELKDRTLDGEGMHWATRRVVLLLTLLFLQRLGVAADDIKPLLKRHNEFAQLWAKAGRPT